MVMNEVKCAETGIFDAYRHFVLEGQKYLSCNYLEINKECKKYIEYKKLTADVFVHPAQVLTAFVDISDDFKLNLAEKQWLCDCV